jgi:hypothetical protein
MTRDDIMAMEGAALSRATAEKLGWTEIQVMIETVPMVRGWITSSDSLASYFVGIPPAGTGPERLPDYARDLRAAWSEVLPVLVSGDDLNPEAIATMLCRALLSL